jgi:rsbT co-antagonist protein RsbR
MQRVIDEFRRSLERLAIESSERVKAAAIPFYQSFPPEALRASIHRVFESVLADMERGEPSACPALLAQLGALRAPKGVPMEDMLRGIEMGFERTSDHMYDVFRDDTEAQLFWEKSRRDIGYVSAMALARAYMNAREQLIAQQNEQILRLSAPLVPISRGVLLLPLVGAVTEARAMQTIGSLLQGIEKHRAQSVIIDITGVPTAGQGVAGYLIQATQAARLMGARIILVGVSPVMAQAIVEMGLDLGEVATLGDLESGVAHALRMQGRSITKVT